MSKNIGLLKFYCYDLEKEITVKDYFRTLIIELWDEGECFSGKRPLGNSGWMTNVHDALLKVGIIEGKHIIEEDEDYWEYDEKEADRIIREYLETEL